MRPAMVMAIALLMTGSSACGSNTVTHSVAAASTAASSAPETVKAGTPSVDAAALCAFIETDLPAVEAAAPNSATSALGTNIGAETQFSGDYASWISEDPATRKLDDATQLDAVTTAQCPEVHSRLVKALGTNSLSTALGS